MPNDTKRGFYRFIDVIGLVEQEKHVKQTLQALTKSLGFEAYAYVNIRSKTRVLISSYPERWQDRYFRQSYQRVDPVIAMAKRKWRPFAWSLDQRQFFHRDREQFVNEARDCGICHGLTIPVPAGFGHVAMLTFASADNTVAPDWFIPGRALSVASLTHAFAIARNVRHRTDAGAGAGLTPQESVCLRWAAEGKSMQETALLLDISYNSVRSYLDNARKKLGSTTLIQAVATATRLNLI